MKDRMILENLLEVFIIKVPVGVGVSTVHKYQNKVLQESFKEIFGWRTLQGKYHKKLFKVSKKELQNVEGIPETNFEGTPENPLEKYQKNLMKGFEKVTLEQFPQEILKKRRV